jgi:hypothetical protein
VPWFSPGFDELKFSTDFLREADRFGAHAQVPLPLPVFTAPRGKTLGCPKTEDLK